MAIATLQQLFIRMLLVIGFISLAACGGGGSSKPKDKTPEAFSFTASTNAEPGMVVTSALVTITGIDTASPITITGGQYSVAGGAFTTAAGTITNNQTLSIRVTASSLTNAEVQAVATIGGVSGAFVVTTAPDVTPNSFDLGSATGVELSSVNTSAAITLSGIDVAVPISITGGEYAINGGSYTSIAGTMSSGQSVTVRVTAAAAHSTAVESTLTIGGISATYTVTTISDTTPNAFSFLADTDVEPNSENISDAITVTGIDAAAPISITNGEYSINSGAYTSVAGTVTLNQAVTVKVVAPNGTDLTQTAVLTIGGVTGSYVVTTFPDDEAPVAEFKFPTPYTMSEADSVTVRGTVTDYNAITSVKVKLNNDEPFDVTPKAEGDYSSWTAVIPLTSNAENTIVVLTEDEKGNVDDNAAQVVIRQAPVASVFPDAMNQFVNPYAGIEYDNYDGRDRLLVPGASGKKIFSVDLLTGARGIYADLTANGGQEFRDISIDPISKRLFLMDFSLFELNLADGGFIAKYDTGLLPESTSMVVDNLGNDRKLIICGFDEDGADVNVVSFLLGTNTFSTVSALNPDLEISLPNSISLDAENNRYLVTVNQHAIIAINRENGVRTMYENEPLGDEDVFSMNGFLSTGNVNFSSGNYYVVESGTNKLFEINLNTNERKLLASLRYKNGTSQVISTKDVKIDEINNRAFFLESYRDGILLVDLETGEKVIVSKNLNNFQ